jgi:hypothetical protein
MMARTSPKEILRAAAIHTSRTPLRDCLTTSRRCAAGKSSTRCSSACRSASAIAALRVVVGTGASSLRLVRLGTPFSLGLMEEPSDRCRARLGTCRHWCPGPESNRHGLTACGFSYPPRLWPPRCARLGSGVRHNHNGHLVRRPPQVPAVHSLHLPAPRQAGRIGSALPRAVAQGIHRL